MCRVYYTDLNTPFNPDLLSQLLSLSIIFNINILHKHIYLYYLSSTKVFHHTHVYLCHLLIKYRFIQVHVYLYYLSQN